MQQGDVVGMTDTLTYAWTCAHCAFHTSEGADVVRATAQWQSHKLIHPNQADPPWLMAIDFSEDEDDEEPPLYDADNGNGAHLAEERIKQARAEVKVERRSNGNPVAGHWTHDRILEAFVRWAEQHDGKAPSSTEWMRAPDGYPNTNTVKREFGSWNRAVVQAGLEPSKMGRKPGTKVPAKRAKQPSSKAVTTKKVSEKVSDESAPLVVAPPSLADLVHGVEEAAARLASAKLALIAAVEAV